jgi:hypothetical protein
LTHVLDGDYAEDDEIAEDEAVLAAIQAAVNDAIEEHRREGRPIVICDEDGHVRWVPADEIEPLDPPPDR